MINSIIEAVSITLDNRFGSNYAIYNEEVKQDLKEPCFFISCVESKERLFFNRRYFRQNNICIQYFPKDEDKPERECMEVAECLFDCLEWLDVYGDLTMGTGMRYEIADGILHFFVNYDFYTYRTAKTETLMGEVNKNVSLRG